MRKVFIIAVLVLICFVVEFFSFNFLGRWFKPNLSIILLVFFNFYWGTRYGVVTAVLSGLIKDSFTANPFGLNMVSFIICVYLTTFIRRHFYYLSSSTSRIQIVFILCIVNVLAQYVINALYSSIEFMQLFVYVILPEMLITTLVAGYSFQKIKNFVLRIV